jgi:hypothetical protein
MIKFNDHNVTNTETKEKCKIRYSLDNHISGKPNVTIYAKTYAGDLFPIFSNAQNATDSMTDYFEKDRVRFFEGDEHYEAARAAAEKKAAKDEIRWQKKYNKVA